jgi:hypothetical protein
MYLEVDRYVIKDVTIDIQKRRRGRPRKHPIKPEIADNRNIKRGSIEKKKRRGRPLLKKSAVIEESIPEVQQITAFEFNKVLHVKRGRGRPRRQLNQRAETTEIKPSTEQKVEETKTLDDPKTDWRHTTLMELLKKFLPEYVTEESQV